MTSSSDNSSDEVTLLRSEPEDTGSSAEDSRASEGEKKKTSGKTKAAKRERTKFKKRVINTKYLKKIIKEEIKNELNTRSLANQSNVAANTDQGTNDIACLYCGLKNHGILQCRNLKRDQRRASFR